MHQVCRHCLALLTLYLTTFMTANGHDACTEEDMSKILSLFLSLDRVFN